MATKGKTHKASAKRFKVKKSGKVTHLAQGGGNGHGNNYKNRRQRKATKGESALGSIKEARKIKRLISK